MSNSHDVPVAGELVATLSWVVRKQVSQWVCHFDLSRKSTHALLRLGSRKRKLLALGNFDKTTVDPTQ